ncbi:hypothetical protein NMG60_11032601 [Bertholletia excelsa]
MERGEPTLIPQWLKVSGTASGGTTTHQTTSSSLHADDQGASKHSRNKPSPSVNDHEIGRSFVLDRTTSSYFRCSSSSNGSAHLRSHGSFGRSNRDRDWEKEIYDSRDKEKSTFVDHRRREYSDPLDNILPSRFEKDLRRSQSLTSGKVGETWPRKKPADSSNSNKSNFKNSNALSSGGSTMSSVHNKTVFDREFPSLGAEERPPAPEIGRVSSPGLTTAIQSLPMSTSAVIGGDGWTSALAEVPVLVGNNTAAGTILQTIPTTAASLSSNMTTGLNMAETLAQGPSRAQTPGPQVSAETQRLEELAIKQSRQLIPVTPSMPKALALNPSEKPKPKGGFQQQHQTAYSLFANHSPRNGPVKSDVTRTSSAGKLHVLRLAREKNGVFPAAKDSLSPTSAGRVMSSPVAVASTVAGPAPSRNPSNNTNLVSSERKPTLATFEKRPSPQAQSRNDFFNLVRKKSMTSASAATPNPGAAVSPSVSNSSDRLESGCTPVIPRDKDFEITNGLSVNTGSSIPESVVGDQSDKNTNDMSSNGHIDERTGESLDDRSSKLFSNGKGHSGPPAILYSEEEEAAFLRSLGWEESAEEDEGLTEEEISSFYKEAHQYMKLKSSSRILQGIRPKFLVPPSLQEGSVGGYMSSGSSSSDSKF